AKEKTAALDRVQKELNRSEAWLYYFTFREAFSHFERNDFVAARLSLDDCHWDKRGPEYGYLVKQMSKRFTTLLGHTDAVSCLALSLDGKRLCSGSNDRTITVWDLGTDNEPLILRGHTSDVTSLALSPDGKQLYSGSKDKTIKAWDLDTGQGRLVG